MTFLLSMFYRVEKDTPLSVRAWNNQISVLPKPEIAEDKVVLAPRPAIKAKSGKISKDKVTTQIKKNIYFLETLITELEEHIEYYTYTLKLHELKDQSQGCLRILFRIKEDAPYYLNTLKTVYSHTKTISELMEENSWL